METMKNDCEAMFICSHIVSEFNDQILSKGDQSLLLEFVHQFIYEIVDLNNKSQYRYYYGENFIAGKYEKLNNNAGW